MRLTCSLTLWAEALPTVAIIVAFPTFQGFQSATRAMVTIPHMEASMETMQDLHSRIIWVLYKDSRQLLIWAVSTAPALEGSTQVPKRGIHNSPVPKSGPIKAMNSQGILCYTRLD